MSLVSQFHRKTRSQFLTLKHIPRLEPRSKQKMRQKIRVGVRVGVRKGTGVLIGLYSGLPGRKVLAAELLGLSQDEPPQLSLKFL